MARILVLEDEKAINDLVALNLSMVGHTTVQTFTGGEALKAASIQPIDLMIIDVMLPYARSFAEAGKPIEYFTDGRVVVHRTKEETR